MSERGYMETEELKEIIKQLENKNSKLEIEKNSLLEFVNTSEGERENILAELAKLRADWGKNRKNKAIGEWKAKYEVVNKEIKEIKEIVR